MNQLVCLNITGIVSVCMQLWSPYSVQVYSHKYHRTILHSFHIELTGPRIKNIYCSRVLHYQHLAPGVWSNMSNTWLVILLFTVYGSEALTVFLLRCFDIFRFLSIYCTSTKGQLKQHWRYEERVKIWKLN